MRYTTYITVNLVDGKYAIINPEQVAFIMPSEKGHDITMTNGKELKTTETMQSLIQKGGTYGTIKIVTG